MREGRETTRYRELDPLWFAVAILLVIDFWLAVALVVIGIFRGEG